MAQSSFTAMIGRKCGARFFEPVPLIITGKKALQIPLILNNTYVLFPTCLFQYWVPKVSKKYVRIPIGKLADALPEVSAHSRGLPERECNTLRISQGVALSLLSMRF